MPRSKSPELDLSYGRHSLKVFSNPEFRRFSVPKTVETPDSWTANVARKKLVVPKTLSQVVDGEQGTWHLVQLLKDPAKKGNLLAIRKQDTKSPWGYLRVFSVEPSGQEHLVAGAGLEKSKGDFWPKNCAFFHSLWVIPFTLANPNRTMQQVAVLKEKELELSSIRFPRGKKPSPSELAVWEDRYAQLDLATAQRKSIDPTDLKGRYIEEPAQPSEQHYSYRGKRIGPLLIGLREEIARLAGCPLARSIVRINTAGKFVFKHGWQNLGKADDKHYFAVKVFDPSRVKEIPLPEKLVESI